MTNYFHYFVLSVAFMCADVCRAATTDIPVATGANTSDGHDTLNVVILGDSNTFNTNTKATVTNTQEKIDVIGNNNVIYNQIVRLKQAHAKGHQPTPHLIIIAAGTNDAWFTKHRPLAYDKTARQVFADSQTFTTKRNVNTVLTLAESVRYGCEMLMESFPGAQVVLVTPPQCVKVDSDKMLLTGDIIEQCGEYMGIGVIRLDKIGAINATRERQQKHYTADGVHTNRLGARRNGTIIARQVGVMLGM